MKRIIPVDVSRQLFDIHRDLSVTTRAQRRGPPVRIDGMTVGIITISEDAPHRGEVHPDGDEILYVVSGSVQVTGESAPDAPIELHAGEACIVPKGEWHQVHVLEKTQLIQSRRGRTAITGRSRVGPLFSLPWPSW
jgi:quercetin dioxygenase-like cupin family protein